VLVPRAKESKLSIAIFYKTFIVFIRSPQAIDDRLESAVPILHHL
jgi:hypothetical protein